jgi:DNA invertase Pin-like site-specific DNA recombinase
MLAERQRGGQAGVGSKSTQAGLEAARARGRQGRRPKTTSLATPQQIAMLQALYADKSNSIEYICATLHISRATLYRYVKPTS